MWWSLYLLVVNVPFGFITIFGPINITFMIIKVSGVRLLNKRFERDDKYADYKRRTSAFIPWFPKKKNSLNLISSSNGFYDKND
jgi:steroid 5-alpha reductase family enzyme